MLEIVECACGVAKLLFNKWCQVKLRYVMSMSNLVEKTRVEVPIEKLRDVIDNHIWELTEYRLGQVLTIIDASIADPEQRKGLKDLVKDAFHQPEYYGKGIKMWLWEFAKKFTPNQLKDIKEDRFLGELKVGFNTPMPKSYFD